MWRNSDVSYGWCSILLHWLSLPLVAFLLASGIYMVTLTYYDTLYHTLPQWHKVAGVALTLLTFLRLLWLAFNPHPALLPMPLWQRIAARAAHSLLYLLMLVLIVSGYCITTAEGHPIHVVGSLQVPAFTTWSAESVTWLGIVHQWSGYALGGVVCVHAGAALHHHLFLRDNTLRRMLYPLRSSRS